MSNSLKGEFDTAITANGVWICFNEDITLKDIEEARRLLNEVADELILKEINDVDG